MTDNLSTLDVLVAARKLIEKPESWGQGALHSFGGAHCAVGAMEKAITCLRGYVPSLEECYIDGFGSWVDMVEWNDADERTHAEVLAAFDRAIAAERAKMEAAS